MKSVIRSALVLAMCTALSSPSWAIMACGNSWTPTPPGGQHGWGLTTFDPSIGTANLGHFTIDYPTNNDAALFASFVSGAPAFSSSDYAFDCSIVLVPATTKRTFTIAAGWIDQPVPGASACRINKAPTVDMNFVNNLRSQGYVVSISYPQTDPGTGIGIVSWSKMSNGFNMPCPAGVTGYNIDGYKIANSCAVSDIGLAYVSNAGYANQWSGAFGTDLASKMAAAGFSAADRAHASIVGLWGPHASVPADSCPLQGTGAYPAVMIGDYTVAPVQPPPAPPLPPPPTVANRSANSINIGQSGSAAGFGAGSAGTAIGQGDAAFDLNAFCNAPSARDGKPRSHAWIRACLSSGGQ